MTWFKLDDAWWRSRKIRKLGRRRVEVSAQVAGAGVWSLAGDWAADNLTDGFVPWEVVEDWDPEHDIAARLIEVGFWFESECDGEPGVQFHNWAEWQPTKEQVTQRRKADADRRARWRDAKRNGEQRDDVTADETSASRRDAMRDSQQESRQGSALPVPARPGPSRTTTSSANADAPAEKTVDDWFDELWQLWPRKVAKATAKAKYRLAVRKGADPQHINAQAAAQVAVWKSTGKDPQFIPHASTWLNQGRYDDEVENPNQTVLSVVPDLPVSVESLRERAAGPAARQAANEAAVLIGDGGFIPDRPRPRDSQLSELEWMQHLAREFIDDHAAEIRAALERKAAG